MVILVKTYEHLYDSSSRHLWIYPFFADRIITVRQRDGAA